jgi:hypothetical protein
MRSVVFGCSVVLAMPAWASDDARADATSTVASAEATAPVGTVTGASVALLPQLPLDRADASLQAEARAMADLVVAIKREVREGRLELSTEAKLAWQAGVVDFDNVTVRGQVGDWRTAYIAAIQARMVVLRGADEAFSVGAAEPVRLALKAYVDAVEPRVEAARQLLRLNGRDDLEK